MYLAHYRKCVLPVYDKTVRVNFYGFTLWTCLGAEGEDGPIPSPSYGEGSGMYLKGTKKRDECEKERSF